MEQVQITYTHNKPYGIRNKEGFLLFFPEIQKYPGQEDRYKQEINRQHKLADYLKDKLEKLNIKGNRIKRYSQQIQPSKAD